MTITPETKLAVSIRSIVFSTLAIVGSVAGGTWVVAKELADLRHEIEVHACTCPPHGAVSRSPVTGD